MTWLFYVLYNGGYMSFPTVFQIYQDDPEGDNERLSAMKPPA